MINKELKYYLRIGIEPLFIIVLMIIALISRFKKKKIDIGFGPDPLINNIYHKKALQQQGYSVETFIWKPFFITNEFDIVLSERYNITSFIGKIKALTVLILTPFKYKILYIYFNGGPLGRTRFLWKIEPFIYKLANIKTVIMPYGGDIQEMSRSTNLLFKHTMTLNYPGHKEKRKIIEKKIDLWTRQADHVISGCEWVDYMYHWDTLMLAHFSIDIDLKDKQTTFIKDSTNKFRILHAPNHRAIKGTEFLIDAVSELKKEGLSIELVMLEKVPNEKVIELIQEVDLVADQFIIGWYAMFTIEAMKYGKPVLCYLRDDLVDLYTAAKLVEKDEIPIINTHWSSIKDNIRVAYNNRQDLQGIGIRSREYVKNHHSTEYIGTVFASINKRLLGKL